MTAKWDLFCYSDERAVTHRWGYCRHRWGWQTPAGSRARACQSPPEAPPGARNAPSGAAVPQYRTFTEQNKVIAAD